MKIICTILVCGLVSLAGASNAWSLEKAPSQTLGLGVNAGQSIGAYVYYAVTSTIHVGSGVGLKVQENSNLFFIGPYARFLFPVSGGLYAYVMPQLNLYFGDASATELEVGAGMQAWVASNLAVWGGVSVLNIGFDPSYTIFGIVYPRGGVEFNL